MTRSASTEACAQMAKQMGCVSSVHIRPVCNAALFALISGYVVCRAGVRRVGSGVTSPTPMHP